MISYNEAIELIKNLSINLKTESIHLPELTGRVLAQDVVAKVASPAFTNSAMDGIGIVYTDLEKGPLEVLSTVFAKDNPVLPARKEGACIKVMTGGAVPEWVDTVVPVENTEVLSNGRIQVNDPGKKGSHIRYYGEDVAKGDLVFSKGTRITPEKLGVIASFGHRELQVYEKPHVHILTTGDELAEPGEELQPGTIYNSSKFFLQAAFERLGLTPKSVKTLVDKPEEAFNEVASLLKEDGTKLIITTGAVSAGEKDFIPGLAKDLGFEKIFHKTLIRPGKPNYLAKKDDTIWLGLAGNAVSTMVGFHFFAKVVLESVWNIPNTKMRELELTEDFKKPEHLRCFFRGKKVDQDSVVVHKKQGSSHLLATLTSDSFVQLPEGQAIVPAGTKVKVLEIL